MKKGIIMSICIILGLLSIFYGFYVRRAASGTGFYRVWIVMGIGMFFVAALEYFEVFAKLPFIIKMILTAGVGIGLILVVVISGLVFSNFDGKGEEDIDYVIVLGAQMKNSGPSVALRYRLDTAIDYLKKNEKALCIVSGGQGSNEPVSEAEGMRAYMVERGIDESRIIKEDKSINTKQNFDYSMELVDLKDKKVGIVTNNFHAYRASKIAEKCGLKNVSVIAAGSVKTYLPNNMFREVLAVVKDFIVGNI